MDDPHDIARAVALFEERYGATPRHADLVVLTELLARFAHLPYENLSKILAWANGAAAPTEARRGPRRVMEDHLALGTGGTCFSLTDLLRCLAGASGFRCYPVMAHMRHGANIHCALRVEAGGPTSSIPAT
jgi:arylamine N-acetyltransferase